jgi:hypothetical protein
VTTTILVPIVFREMNWLLTQANASCKWSVFACNSQGFELRSHGPTIHRVLILGLPLKEFFGKCLSFWVLVDVHKNYSKVC